MRNKTGFEYSLLKGIDNDNGLQEVVTFYGIASISALFNSAYRRCSYKDYLRMYGVDLDENLGSLELFREYLDFLRNTDYDGTKKMAEHESRCFIDFMIESANFEDADVEVTDDYKQMLINEIIGGSK